MIPRSEHPNPQFERNDWINLNGEWEFEIDYGVSGIERRFFEREHLNGKILVPFCMESSLSGIGEKDFVHCVWYRRDIERPDEWKNGRVILHFGAVDQTTHVFINGRRVGNHVGGFASFSFDVTDFLVDGANSLYVCAIDDGRSIMYGHGKQAKIYPSSGCSYTRVTGIWQTVWLEYVPNNYIKSFRLIPDVGNSTLTVSAKLFGKGVLKAEAFYEGRAVGEITLDASNGGYVTGCMPLSELHLWEVGNGRLYDLKLTFGDDEVSSYFGMRTVVMDGYKFLINGKSVFQRLVLDQGYYPDGIYTAPTDEDLVKDIQLSLDAGFNGARLHEKVFEPRYLYHCDRMGYIVWGEYGNWGMDHSDSRVLAPFALEWEEIVERDFNHPSIIGWCPFNETVDFRGERKQDDNIIRSLYRETKMLDPTRPCIDTSGFYHVETDIFDIHDYTQDPVLFKEIYGLDSVEEILRVYGERTPFKMKRQKNIYVHGQPVFVSEYGGIKWDIDPDAIKSWGYGTAPTTEEEFIERYRGLTDVLLDCPLIFGFCYTQLYDIEQEKNGLYTYARVPKFDMSVFKKINERKAKIED